MNYDFTLLALLLQSCQGSMTSECIRCPVHPLRKRKTCLVGTGMERAADVSLILTWHKIDDDVRDHGFFLGLPYRFVRRWFAKAYRKAAQACPEFDACVRTRLSRLSDLEREQSAQLDQVAHEFSSILASAAHEMAQPEQERVLEHLLYHVGRWIYLVDAWDDLEEDTKCGRYNPLNARFHGNVQAEKEYLATTCTHSTRLAANAANLLELGSWQVVVDNILCVGLPAVQSAVMDGRWKEIKKRNKGRYAHERSV